MQHFLAARKLRTIPPSEIKLNLQPLDTVVMKAPFKKKTILQDYSFLDYPIMTMFNGLIVVHVLMYESCETEQLLLLVSNEPKFTLSKPDLMQIMSKATSIARTITIVGTLSSQSASVRHLFLKTMHVGEILGMEEIFNKMDYGDVPRYRVLSEAEKVAFFKETCSTPEKRCQLSYLQDGIGRYLGFLPGMVVYNIDKKLHRVVTE